MKKVFTVKELISFLLEFNMDAYVKVNTNGQPTAFDICWNGYGTDTNEDTRKITDEIYFDVTQEENV
ncbi:MAG: hypothetical protein MR836_08160 [Ruminococcus sp.]|nr:hypothetical protein [Ruminococcus sp.]